MGAVPTAGNPYCRSELLRPGDALPGFLEALDTPPHIILHFPLHAHLQTRQVSWTGGENKFLHSKWPFIYFENTSALNPPHSQHFLLSTRNDSL